MLKALVPAPVVVGRRERWRAIIGALTGILVAGLLCRWAALAWNSTPWLMAPLGASAVLVFTLPASPLAQPWAVVSGANVNGTARSTSDCDASSFGTVTIA